MLGKRLWRAAHHLGDRAEHIEPRELQFGTLAPRQRDHNIFVRLLRRFGLQNVQLLDERVQHQFAYVAERRSIVIVGASEDAGAGAGAVGAVRTDRNSALL